MDWTRWLLILLPNLVASVDPDLRKELIEFAKRFRELASKTKNPWNTFIAEVLCWAIGLDG